MKHRPPPVAIFSLLLIVLAGTGYWYYTNNPGAWRAALADFGLASTAEGATVLTASGFIEVNEIDLSSEISGRVEAVTAVEGESVSAGQPLVFLETSLLDGQLGQIEAQIALAGAQLDRIRAGLPRERLAVAEVSTSLAETRRDEARQSWLDAQTLRDNPQQLTADIDAAYAELDLIGLQVEQARLIRDAVELREQIAEEFWDLTQRGVDFSISLPGGRKISGHADFPEGDKQQASVEWNLATIEVWQAWVSWEDSNAAYTGAQNKLGTLLALKENPIQADLQVTQAEAAYKVASAEVEVAKAGFRQLSAGATEAEVGILEAQLAEAKARLATLRAQREKYTIISPLEGVVVDLVANDGEIAVPGATLLTVANLDSVSLTVFVPGSDYGRLRPGQTVEVYVDSYPGDAFRGRITRIGDEAEFTPKNVQTREERVSLVYAIEITLGNDTRRLKPGMPADANFVEALAIEEVRR